MRRLARLSLAVGGLSLALPLFANAQQPAPPLVAPSAPILTPDEVSKLPSARQTSAGEYAMPTGVVVSEKDSKAMEAQIRRLGPPHVVSQGTVVQGQPMMAPGQAMSAAGAPGRAVVTDAPAGYASTAPGEPAPIGVMRTNYNNAPVGTPAAGMGMAPGMGMGMGPGHGAGPQGSSPLNPMMSRHGMPNSPMGGGSSPFLPSSATPRPRVLAHLFGFEGIGNAMRDSREARIEARRRRDILKTYNGGNGAEEVPASAVYNGRSR